MTTAEAELKPLKIRCTSSDCEQQLHCFKKTRKMKPEQFGECRSCGVQLVDWQRVQQRDPADMQFTFASLKHEAIRHHFFHAPIDEAAQSHARRKGCLALREAAVERLRKSIGRAEPARDGRQTPFEGNILYYAQHALACCCRTCLEYWHGIPKGRELAEDEIAYLVELVMCFVAERLPALPDEGEYIPRRHR
jgi:hypothetical protein